LGCEAQASIAWANNAAQAWGAADGEGPESGRQLRGNRVKAVDFFLQLKSSFEKKIGILSEMFFE